MNRRDDISHLEDMDFVVPASTAYEDYPYSQNIIIKAIEMSKKGVDRHRMAKELDLELPRMLYWISQYQKGRRWESEPQL